MGNSKIFIVTNNFMPDLNMKAYSYIYVGDKNKCPKEGIRDDKGDNIADLNNKYNELTAIYWVYKHLDEYKDLKYIGFCQYRRMFAFQGLNKNAFVKRKIKNDLISLNEDGVDNYFKFYDLIAPRPSNVKSVFHQYAKAHNSYDLPTLLNIIQEKFPKYYKYADEYFNGKKNYLYNSFVFKREDFVEYSEFIFPLIEEYRKIANKLPDRFYFTERLTGLFIYYLTKSKKYVLKVPVLYVKNYTFKTAKDISIDLFKNSSNNGLIYKLKPILLYFLPNLFEQYIRRRIAR